MGTGPSEEEWEENRANSSGRSFTVLPPRTAAGQQK
jgi:hypothetical protein